MLRTTVSCAKGVYAVTNLGRLQIPSDKPQQNPERCSITICDKQFKRMSKSGLSTLGNIPASKDLTKLPDGVKDLQGLISMVLLHEVSYLILTWGPLAQDLTSDKFSHTSPYLTDDLPDGKAYGWDNIVAKSTADSVKSADDLSKFIILPTNDESMLT